MLVSGAFLLLNVIAVEDAETFLLRVTYVG